MAVLRCRWLPPCSAHSLAVVQAKELMNQDIFWATTAYIEKRWMEVMDRRLQAENKAPESHAPQRQQQQPQAQAQSAPQAEKAPQAGNAPQQGAVQQPENAPPPAASRHASLPPRAPVAKPASAAGPVEAAEMQAVQSEGRALAEASGQPRRALGELPVLQ